MLSVRIIGYLSTRSFTRFSNLASRFTRDGLRDRLRHQEIKELTKNREVFNQKPNSFPSDARPIRPISHLKKAFGFTVAVSATSFTVAIVAEILRRKDTITPENVFKIVKNYFDFSNGSNIKVETSSNIHFTAGEKNLAFLIGLNVVVFLLWKAKNIQPLMQRYFTNSFASKSLCWPMLLSAFSHQSIIHLGLNMYVMTTFAPKIIDNFLGVEQFWGFYVAAAVISSFVSLADKALARNPIRALGASGAILAVLTYTCMQIPNARLQLIFVPGFDFSAEHAVWGIVAFDFICLLLRFRLFDHAAHLGGSLFGIAYAKYGQSLIWEQYGLKVEETIKKVRD